MILTLIAQSQGIGNIDVSGTTRYYTENPTNSPIMLNNIFSQIVGFLTIAAGLAFLIYFIIGAISWVTAGGDAKKVDTAKSFLTNGAIGMIVIVAAYSIIWIVGEVVGLDILNPGNTFQKLFTPPIPTENTYTPLQPI